MILANVAVARELERGARATLYRVHGKPEEKKLDAACSRRSTRSASAADSRRGAATRDLQRHRRPRCGRAERGRSSSRWSCAR